MIDVDLIRELTRCKSSLHHFLREHPESLEPERAWTEGLVRSIEIGRRPWTYVRTQQGWQFTCQKAGRQVELRRDGRGAAGFSSRELCTWLRSCDDDRYGRINETVIENWLCRALIGGRVEGLDDPPGYFRLAS